MKDDNGDCWIRMLMLRVVLIAVVAIALWRYVILPMVLFLSLLF